MWRNLREMSEIPGFDKLKPREQNIVTTAVRAVREFNANPTRKPIFLTCDEKPDPKESFDINNVQATLRNAGIVIQGTLQFLQNPPGVQFRPEPNEGFPTVNKPPVKEDPMEQLRRITNDPRYNTTMPSTDFGDIFDTLFGKQH